MGLLYLYLTKEIEKYFKFYCLRLCLKELKKGTKTPCLGSNNFTKYTKTQFAILMLQIFGVC